MKECHERVVIEKEELDLKRLKLSNYIDSAHFQTLRLEDQNRLNNQGEAMLLYSTILGNRIEVFGNKNNIIDHQIDLVNIDVDDTSSLVWKRLRKVYKERGFLGYCTVYFDPGFYSLIVDIPGYVREEEYATLEPFAGEVGKLENFRFIPIYR